LGIIVDEKLGLINHSCDPNAYIVMDGPEVAVRALKPIKKDEEIFIAYIDTTNPYPRRQSELKARWFFTCRCTKCAKGPTLLEDKWAIEPRNLADKWKERGDVLMRRDFAKDPANYVGESQDEKRVAAIQGQAFDMYETEQRTSEPTEAIRVIEEGMRLCYQSGLWPVYRQPYAAFRDDLIVNMLSVENFEIAWAQCAKRYRYMLPKLYQQKAHPVRVVQVWQTAMLAMYIADKQPMPPGVDLRLISLMLVNEVKDLCSLSHGENNSFSKSVQTMFYEMMTTLREQLGPAAADRMVAQIPEQRRKFLEMGDWTQY
jgi:SET and MYND domain-containing protein